MNIQGFSLVLVIYASIKIIDMFEGNYAEAHHSIPLPSIAHHSEFPFEHAHRVAVPNPGKMSRVIT
jgi:hypothetical protein